MGHAIPVRMDYTAGEVRRLAQRAKDAAQARRLLAIAAVLDGASREEAAKIGGMDRQTLRDWVIRFNEQGADGLINIPSPGMPPKLNGIHKAFLARIVEEGPISAIHGVVRWRACDLIMRLHEEFGLSVSDDTIYRALTFDMTIFAKKTMSVTEWAKVQDLIGALQISMGAPHDLMMFSAKGSVLGEDDIYIGLPDASLLSAFPGFEKVERQSLPDFLVTLVVREDGFEERFPDISKKRRSRIAR